MELEADMCACVKIWGGSGTANGGFSFWVKGYVQEARARVRIYDRYPDFPKLCKCDFRSPSLGVMVFIVQGTRWVDSPLGLSHA